MMPSILMTTLGHLDHRITPSITDRPKIMPQILMITLVTKITPLSLDRPGIMPSISMTAPGHEDHLDPLNLSSKAALTKYRESHDFHK
jgi:hypothetical protein